MAITYGGNVAKFESVVYEDEVVSFRDFLQEKAPSGISAAGKEARQLLDYVASAL